MTRDEVLAQICANPGRFFSVQFVKRTDSTVRTMVCRTGVRKGVKGTGRAYDAVERNLIPVYDVQARGYRLIPIEGIVRYNGKGVEPSHTL